MGINPKIGITGLPRSGKSIVLQKVIDMIMEGGGLGSRRMRGPNAPENIIGGMRTEIIIENGERMGFACVNILTGEKGVMAHREIDSRNRILGFGIDPSEIERVGVPAIMDSIGNCEIMVIDEIGKFIKQRDFDLHIAFEVTLKDLKLFFEKGKKLGIETRGISDHGFIKSIYFHQQLF